MDTVKLQFPKEFTNYEGEVLMSNLDHEINHEVAVIIKGSPLFGVYAAWNFYGKVWWESSLQKWACEIWIYGSSVEIIVKDTLEEIMQTASEEYGHY